MDTFIKFRVNKEYLYLLSNSIRFSTRDKTFVSITLSANDESVEEIRQINEKVGGNLYFDWEIIHKYTEKELSEASLFRIKILNTIETSGEEGGSLYNDGVSCPICGAGRKLEGPLSLSCIPSKVKYDICKTLSGEIVVSRRFQELSVFHNFQGMEFHPIIVQGEPSPFFMQLKTASSVEISNKTRFGTDFFDQVNVAYSNEKKLNICGHEIIIPREVYVCPNLDLLGLNLLSELYVKKKSVQFHSFDVARTSQYIGVKRGLLRPEPLYVCSKRFFEVAKKEKIIGIDFDVVQISDI